MSPELFSLQKLLYSLAKETSSRLELEETALLDIAPIQSANDDGHTSWAPLFAAPLSEDRHSELKVGTNMWRSVQCALQYAQYFAGAAVLEVGGTVPGLSPRHHWLPTSGVRPACQGYLPTSGWNFAQRVQLT